jgi:hypothetical protein
MAWAWAKAKPKAKTSLAQSEWLSVILSLSSAISATVSHQAFVHVGSLEG